jgi:NAD(P)-dependent dehydrogenase (short-subunit alcohol dehydrogenase family)
VLLAGDEADALAATSRAPGVYAYPASKLALARWVRHHAPTTEWIGAGIRLNAIAPGVIETPMTKNDLEFIFSIPDVFPVPIGRPGRPEEIASLLAYLLSPDAGFFCGSVVFADGGTDAAVRADGYPTPRA